MKTQDERISHLEEENYFLTHKLRELDDVLTEQQTQMDRLGHRLEEAITALGRLRASIEELGAGKQNPELEVPPHYGKW